MSKEGVGFQHHSARKPTSNALQVAAMRCCAHGGGVHAEFDDGEELDVFFLHEWNNDWSRRILGISV